MPQLAAFAILAFILYIGDVAATRSKSKLPSVFICAVLFLLGYWTFFPENIVEIAGIPTPVVYLAMYLLITNMGTLLSIDELKRQWRTVVIALTGIAGIGVFLFTVGQLFLDYQTIIVATPPLTGGIVSSLIMSQAASEAGLESLAVLAILIYVMQGFIGYPLTSMMLQREGRRVLGLYRSGQWKTESDGKSGSADHDPHQPRLFKKLPPAYNTTYFKLLALSSWC